ncbi:hypothetical protein LSH36_1008g00019 [Paralvinella palmiformis]|uniref:Uncharacterized protein n=1 Tax=Paralvinella palmiformis TaxID=53620 RepID=A0AAD9MQ99_9ANNE|nr:hypothetical protein LSH36_1008g00019 [Paralvinella palmiformis]
MHLVNVDKAATGQHRRTLIPDERTDITKKNEHLVLTDCQPIICHKMTNEAPLMFSLPVIMKSISYWMNALMRTAGNFVAFLMLVLLHSSVTVSLPPMPTGNQPPKTSADLTRSTCAVCPPSTESTCDLDVLEK